MYIFIALCFTSEMKSEDQKRTNDQEAFLYYYTTGAPLF